jgi:NADH:ubiquinone oxidoreductase subunit F (NADH-binding)
LQATQAVLRELAQAMQLTSICGLGTVASNPLTSLLTHFREDVDHYLKPA